MEQKQPAFRDPIILEILEKYKVIWSLSHLSSLANWDLETYMPVEGSEARGIALGKVAILSQKLFLEDDFIRLIKQAGSIEDLTVYEKAVLRMLNRSLKYYQKLPSEFIEEFTIVTTESHLKWREAREKKDFSIFAPYLEKIVELSRKKAEYLGYKNHPYDALLDEFEEELTTEIVEKYFSEIKQPLIDILEHIKKSPKYKDSHELEDVSYDLEKMKVLSNKVLEKIHYNLDHIRLDLSPHPFTITLGKGDTRITTRHEGIDFKRSVSGTIHEYGHALYDLQTEDNLYYTPISGGSSLVLHESQSRFWENFIAKSRDFIDLIQEDLIILNPEYSPYSIEDFYEYLNQVKPSFIRTEADEVTYHFHIIIRYEIEKGLLEGKIQVKDLPKIWNEKYKAYLGIIPENDSIGVLQDVHWSQGLIGYFPTYSLGTALSCMWKHHLEKEIGNIKDLLKSKDGIKKIQDWLKHNIHKYGSTYTFNELVKKTTEEDFTSKYLLDYLNKKYREIY